MNYTPKDKLFQVSAKIIINQTLIKNKNKLVIFIPKSCYHNLMHLIYELYLNHDMYLQKKT